MTVCTNKGDFGSFSDVLTDMECEGYDSIEVKDVLVFPDIISVGKMLGTLTKQDIQHIISDPDNIDGLIY